MNPMNAHPTREEDFDLYALGALDADERQAIESHISACADCSRKLAQAHGRIALLALAAPPAEPSPSVKERLMAQVRASREIAALSAPALAPRAGEPASGGFLGRWWAGVLIPVGAALALATIFLWSENVRLDRELAALHSAMLDQQQQLTAARKAADAVSAQSKLATMSWTGWISDNDCGVKGMTSAHKDCAMMCIKEKHAYWVFVESSSKSIIRIHNQDGVVPATSLGAEMKVTGHVMDDGTLEVDHISAAR
jgi:hypothetical protein